MLRRIYWYVLCASRLAIFWRYYLSLLDETLEGKLKSFFNGVLFSTSMEDDLERTLSLVHLDGVKTGLVKPIKFFDPDEANREWPQYEDPLTQRINEIINTNRYIPFQILSAIRTREDEKERLELKGKYETFDGLTVEVTFKGVYGNPEKTGLAPPLAEDDSFSSYDLEARVIGADPRQERVFSMIGLRDRDIRFSSSQLRDIKPEYKFAGWSEAGLDKIKKIGKIVGIYEHLHIRDLIGAIFEKRNKFQEELANIPFGDYRLDLQVMEFEAPDEETNFLVRHFRNIAYEFIPVVRIKAIKENDVYTTTINYDSALGREDAVWTIDVKWPYLNTIFNLHEEVRLANSTKPGSVTLPEEINSLYRRIEFVLDAFGFHYKDPNDIVRNSYDDAFDSAVLDARQEVLERDPAYKPLYITAYEGNVYLLDNGNFISDVKPEDRVLRLRDGNEFGAFESMVLQAITHQENRKQRIFRWFAEKVLRQKDASMRPLVTYKSVRFHFDHDPELKHRVMTFYDIYKRYPEHARSRYNERDPAYVRGGEIDKQRHEEFDRQMKAERFEEGKSS